MVLPKRKKQNRLGEGDSPNWLRRLRKFGQSPAALVRPPSFRRLKLRVDHDAGWNSIGPAGTGKMLLDSPDFP